MTFDLWNLGFWLSSLLPVMVGVLGGATALALSIMRRRGASWVVFAAAWIVTTQLLIGALWVLWSLGPTLPAPMAGASLPRVLLWTHGRHLPSVLLRVTLWVLEGSAAAVLAFAAVSGRPRE